MKVDVSACDQDNNSALHLCCEGHCSETKIKVMRILLNAGINQKIVNKRKRMAFELLKHTDLRTEILSPSLVSKVLNYKCFLTS